MKDIVIIQPWFTAKGHPAQSLLNTARVLSRFENIKYIISKEKDSAIAQEVEQEISCFCDVSTFDVNSSSLREGTLKALFYLFRKRASLQQKVLFFLDGHLVVLALVWPLLRCWVKPSKIGLLYLKGPEKIYKYWITRKIVAHFLGLNRVILYLRTEELENDWRNYFPDTPSGSIRAIPSLELAEQDDIVGSKEIAEQGSNITFGVLGQIRRGKGLEWLVPLFQKHPNIGKLTVAGSYFDEKQAELFPELSSFKGFRNEFLSEVDMLRYAAQQDYLLMLYDNWDSRMESAILYLAAKVRRPVITYKKGWCGRKVAEFGCGLLVPDRDVDITNFLASVPQRGSNEYLKLLKGVDAFVAAHSGENIRVEFMKALLD